MEDRNFLEKHGVDIKKSLEIFGDMDTYNESINDFLSEIKKQKENLKKCKEISDMQNYAISAHSLKSDAKYFGFTKLADLSLKHELESKENNMFYVVNHFDEYFREIEKTENIVKSYLGLEKLDEIDTVINIATDKMLVVDDSVVIENYVNNIFNKDYKVLQAKDGEDAISIINSNNDIKIVLLDLNMPNSNGFKVLDYFKENNLLKKIPVVVITGISSNDIIEKVKKYNINNILLKPFNETAIKNIVDKAIN